MVKVVQCECLEASCEYSRRFAVLARAVEDLAHHLNQPSNPICGRVLSNCNQLDNTCDDLKLFDSVLGFIVVPIQINHSCGD